MLRLALLIGFLTACGGSSKGPTWPKASTSDGSDGGESLAPKPGSVAVSSSDDDDDIVIEKPADKPAVKATEDKPAESPRPTAPTVTAPDDIINTDDLVIEIDD
jgi:hypothetical protein